MDFYKNEVSIMGKICKEPDYRVTATGSKVLSFSICYQKSVKKGDQFENEPHFFDCVQFGPRAELNRNKIKKGDRIEIGGSLAYSTYTTQEGSKRSKVNIVCDRLYMIEPGKEQSATAEPTTNDYDFGEAIPF